MLPLLLVLLMMLRRREATVDAEVGGFALHDDGPLAFLLMEYDDARNHMGVSTFDPRPLCYSSGVETTSPQIRTPSPSKDSMLSYIFTW